MDEFTSKKIIKDVEQIKKSIASIDKTLALQAASLVEHMKRSEANEKALELLKEEFKPVAFHVKFIQTLIKIFAWLGASGMAIYAIEKYI